MFCFCVIWILTSITFQTKIFFFKLRRHFQKKYSIYYLAEHIFDFEIYHYIIYILVEMIDTVLSLKMPCEVQKKNLFWKLKKKSKKKCSSLEKIESLQTKSNFPEINFILFIIFVALISKSGFSISFSLFLKMLSEV